MTPPSSPRAGRSTDHRIVDGYCFDCQGGGCILELAEANERAMRLGPPSKLKPHPWDEYSVSDDVPQEQEAGW